MKATRIFGLVLCLVVAVSAPALAEQDLVQSVLDGCRSELDTYCSQVTPGEGRILACLYAHGDKLSGRCEYALYDAAVQLERAVDALAYVANECGPDLDRLCSEVAAGQGRLLKCLEQNDPKVSPRCKEALKEVGLR